MKHSVRHPIIVDVKAPRAKAPQKTVMTMTSKIEIPMLRPREDIVIALEYDHYEGRGQKRRVVVMEDTAGNYYLPVSIPGFDEIGATNSKAVDIAVGQHLTTRARGVIERLDGKVSYPNGTASKQAGKADLMGQPDISTIPADRIDLEALREEADLIAASAADMAFAGRTLFSKVREPYFAVTSNAMSNAKLMVVFDADLPENTIAVFRLGRYREAMRFAEEVAARGGAHINVDGIRNVVESDSCQSDMNDMGLTVAIATSRAYENFCASFPYGYRAKEVVNQLILDTPLEQIALARRLNAATQDRSYHDLAQDHEALWPLLEEAVDFGAESPFMRGRYPLDLVLDLWNDQTIALDVGRNFAP